jgi:hypothetical protein
VTCFTSNTSGFLVLTRHFRPIARATAELNIIKPRLSLSFLILQKSLRVDRRHAAAAGGGDRLAVDVILHVAAGEDAGNVGLGAIVGEDCAHSISPATLHDDDLGEIIQVSWHRR